MKRAIVCALIFGVIGLVTGPALGMLIAESSSTSGSPMGVKEDGFVGFLYGLGIGPVLGIVLGVAIALAGRPAE